MAVLNINGRANSRSTLFAAPMSALTQSGHRFGIGPFQFA
jgi:hypothetical protein